MIEMIQYLFALYNLTLSIREAEVQTHLVIVDIFPVDNLTILSMRPPSNK